MSDAIKSLAHGGNVFFHATTTHERGDARVDLGGDTSNEVAQLWETLARDIRYRGGETKTYSLRTSIQANGNLGIIALREHRVDEVGLGRCVWPSETEKTAVHCVVCGGSDFE